MADDDIEASRKWLSRLHIADRAAALRWIREVGAVRFFRIASVAKARGRGRPTVAYPKGVERALRLYVKGVASYDEAPGIAAREAFAERDWGGGGPVSLDHLQRRIRGGMNAAPQQLSYKIALEAEAKGFATIFRRPPDPSLSRFSQRPIHVEAIRRPSNQTGVDLSAVDRTRKLAAFTRAFADLIPDDMPISRIAQLYDDMHRALEEVTAPPPQDRF